jgi:hypothetical protein
MVMTNLAEVLMVTNRQGEAEPLLRRSLAAKEKVGVGVGIGVGVGVGDKEKQSHSYGALWQLRKR